MKSKKVEVNEEELLDIFKRINSGDQKITCEKPEEEVVLLLGMTGTGKSTLTNYLAGHQMTAVSHGKGMSKTKVLELGTVKHGVPVADIYTTVPSKHPLVNGIISWDCPGLRGIHVPIQDIPNSFYIKRLFDYAERVKIVLTVSHDSLLTRGPGSLVYQVQKLCKWFNSIDDLKEGLSIVVTKVKRSSVDGKVFVSQDFKDALQDMLKEIKDEKEEALSRGEQYQESLSPEEEALLEFIAGPKGKIALFKVPDKLGLYPITDRDLILQSIAETGFVNKKGVKIAIEPESTLYIIALFNKINAEIVTTLKEAFDALKVQHEKYLGAGDFTAVAKAITEIRDFKESFVKAGDNLEQLKEVFSQATIGNIVGSELQNKFNNLIFFKQAAPQECNMMMLLSTIEDNTLHTLEYLITITSAELIGVFPIIIDQFIDKFYEEITIKQYDVKLDKMQLIKESIKDLIQFQKTDNNVLTLPKLGESLTLKLSNSKTFFNTEVLSSISKLLIVLDKKVQDFCITYLDTHINGLITKMVKHYATLEELENNFNKYDETICDYKLAVNLKNPQVQVKQLNKIQDNIEFVESVTNRIQTQIGERSFSTNKKKQLEESVLLLKSNITHIYQRLDPQSPIIRDITQELQEFLTRPWLDIPGFLRLHKKVTDIESTKQTEHIESSFQVQECADNIASQLPALFRYEEISKLIDSWVLEHLSTQDLLTIMGTLES